MQRGGERYDLIFMGILREEWEARQKEFWSNRNDNHERSNFSNPRFVRICGAQLQPDQALLVLGDWSGWFIPPPRACRSALSAWAWAIGGARACQSDRYLVLYLLIGNLVWRFLSQIFYWITDLINIERWEGTIEYTLMAPIRRMTHMAGQTFFSVVYSLIFTGVILVVTVVVFKIDLSNANLSGGLVMLLAGSFSFVGIGIMASVFPLLFPERGAQMTHVFIALLLLVSGVYYPVDVLPGC